MRCAKLMLFTFLVVGCSSDPPHQLIENTYFKCTESKSLEGGIYGKGPFLRLGPHPAACSSSKWERVSRKEFKALATEWYGKDWCNAIPIPRPERDFVTPID